LKSILLRWARADAFGKTSETHDTYYALKRIMLPVAVAYSILRPSLTAEEDRSLAAWIDPLIRRVDKLFDGDVDFNNHRDLADSVLMVWGAISGDDRLYQKGIDRYAQVLSSARIDGSLPLETRRGSRALWYMRQTLTSMVVMAEVAKGRSTDLYTLADRDVSVWTLFSFLFGGIDNPVLVDAYAAQNYIPGPQPDYRKQDLGFLDRRSNGRHYLANLEAIARPQPGDFDSRRIASAFLEYAADERPLIDEYVGGNATCFWGTKWN
jgi:poly(beta-D-mannuronate) lyase